MYDANGQVQQTTSNYDQAGVGQTVVNYGYDNLGRKTGVTSGSTQLASWQWDGVTGGKGQITQSISRDASGNTYTTKIGKFDSRGRPTESTVTIPANVTGLAGSYTTTVAYNAADAVTSVSHPAAGGLPAETVTTTYDDYGRPSRLTSNLNGSIYVESTGYDAYGRLVDRLYGPEFGGTGVNASREYAYNDTNGTRWLQSIATTTSINELTSEQQKDTYRYDLSGKITELREQASGQTAQSQCFIYDDLGRLSNAFTRSAEGQCAAFGVSDFTGTAPYQTGYAYDRLGNLQSITDTDAAGKATKHDYLYPGYDDAGTWTTANADQPHGIRKTNHITAGVTTSTDTFQYTPDGQMNKRVEPGTSSADAKTTDYTWTKFGQLETVKTTKSSGQELTRYTYDADGNLLVRTSPQETVAYLGGMELRTTNGATVTATRYYTSGTSAVAMRTTGPNGGKVTYLMADTQASTQMAINATTGAATRRRYTPFGDERSGTLPAGTDHGFLGKTEDSSTGLSLLGARAYDPKLGRFLSPDPLSVPYDPQNLSAYSYSSNDPINRSDPSGLQDADVGSACTNHCEKEKEWVRDNILGGSWQQEGESGVDLNDDGYITIFPTVHVPVGWGQAQIYIENFYSKIDELCSYGREDCAGDVSDPSHAMAINGAKGNACVAAGRACPAGTGWGMSAAISGAIAIAAQDREGPGGGGGSGSRSGLSIHCKCFLAGTDVLMADGTTKDIEEIEPGDKVRATNPETGQTGAREVSRLIVTQDDKHFNVLSIATDDGIEHLTATREHPFWSPSENDWTEAGNLTPGMTLLTDNGNTVIVTGNRAYTERATTYNLTVEGLHTYYVLAGETPVLVHNSTCPEYENPGHPDPTGGPNPYVPKKAVLPGDAGEQFAKSVLVDGTRWTKVGSGKSAEYYRYFDDGNGKWHWSGSTNGVTKSGTSVPIPMSRVPIQVKRG
ncbi:polymorphic toxin-type HINT domain-containing protein [Streptomyces sp. NPDC056656]|uniref:polymorphic toxin-type HINT domain-containing protein n=1 Tax=Streptomyces sp. NPDC056656 TaxID=3345895 RepID=UPI0036C200CA